MRKFTGKDGGSLHCDRFGEQDLVAFCHLTLVDQAVSGNRTHQLANDDRFVDGVSDLRVTAAQAQPKLARDLLEFLHELVNLGGAGSYW